MSGNYLVTLAIGKNYWENWRNNFSNSWIEYARKNDIGVIVFTKNLIDQSDPEWKKPTWQKLLVPKLLSEPSLNVINICYLDSDVFINPNSPNIFKFVKPYKIGVVSIRVNMPYSFTEVVHRLELIRSRYLDKKYPLGSALTISLVNLYRYHKLEPQKDELSGGIMLFNLKDFVNLMESWFFKYDANIKSITNNGDQTHISFEILQGNYQNLLDYRFQTIWAYEVAWNHHDIFMKKNIDSKALKQSIIKSITNAFFLHFAGSGVETSMALDCDMKQIFLDYKQYSALNTFYQKELNGEPLGVYKLSTVENIH